ncbi:MAG: hypothetical protein H6606_05510 [Flavobacteriales bacterium]|nr:hypothetical protein [Flavobacteriales bacterium]
MKRNLRIFIITAILFGLNGFDLQAQNVLMEQDVNADTVIPDFGKNRKHFVSTFYDLGFILGQSSGGSDSVPAPSVMAGSSWNLRYGVNYKFKVSNFYSLLLQGSYQRSAYHFKTEEPVLSSKLVTNDLAAEFSNRFNFGRRGDILGYYLELGASASYTFMNKSKVEEEAPDNAGFDRLKTSMHGLDYIEALAYYGHARIGLNRFVLFGDYRLTDKLKSAAGYQLPPLSVGLRIDFGA